MTLQEQASNCCLNYIHHLLSQVPYQPVPHDRISILPREHHPDYHRKPNPPDTPVSDVY